MAVLPMSRVDIYGLKKERKGVLETLQHLGIVDVKVFKEDKGGFERYDTAAQRAKFSKARNDAKSAVAVLDKYAPEKKSVFSSFNGKTVISEEKYNGGVSEREKILGYASEILRLEKKISENAAEKIRLETALASLMPWKDLAVAMNYKGSRSTAVFIGTLPEQKTLEDVLREYNAECDALGYKELKDGIYAEIVSVLTAQTCLMIIAGKAAAAQTEEILRHMGFAAPSVQCETFAASKIDEINDKILKLEENSKDCREKIRQSAENRRSIEFIADYYAMRADKYEVISKLGQSRSTFALTGFVPSRDVERLEETIGSKYCVAVEISDAGDDAPVLLKNNSFAAPLEGVLETFSLPGKGEMDPTAAMAMFYYFLFGLMLSDAAYGIIMVLVCAFMLLRFPRMETGLKKSLKMFFYCGISTTFWGVMFGGYFGDAIPVIAKTFFNKEIEIKPLWFSPINDPMRMLMFSFAVGIVHLFTGLGMKLYSLVKEKQFKDALYDVVFWYLLVGGAIVYLLSMPMFISMSNLGFILPQSVGKAAAIAAGIGAVGIALTAGRTSKNPFKRLAKGLYELYNVTGYLSDILSYSRLLALGLATGVIANVFNKMGSMMGGGILGAILFALIFIVGHTMNIGINLLGAYVHTNRLQFVEFFGKFYEGGGEKYVPFSENTEFYEID